MKEKKLIFSQFVKFLIDAKNLVNFIRRGVTDENRDKIVSLANEVDKVLNTYYMNFDICDCGHPKPVVSLDVSQQQLEFILEKYIDIYELKTGDIVDDLFSNETEEIPEPVESPNTRKAIKVSDGVKQHAGRSDKPIHIKGTLLKVS